MKRQVQKQRLELATTTRQLTRGKIDGELYDSLAAPINNFLEQLGKEIAGLEEQSKVAENQGRAEEHVRAVLLRHADSLDTLDDEGMQQLLRLLNARLTARLQDGQKRVLVTGVLDPSLFTIGRTLA